MRTYSGVPVQVVRDPEERAAVIGPIDYYLRDVDRAMHRLMLGQVPDGSGTPIIDAGPLSDLYLVLLGRPQNQVAHGGTHAAGSLTLASTRHSTKGKVYFGNAKASVYDEANERFGMNETSPDAILHITRGTGAQSFTPNNEYDSSWGLVGTNVAVALNTNDGDTTLIQGNQAASGGTGRCEFGLSIAAGITQYSGWILHILARHGNAQVSQDGSGTIPSDAIGIYVNRTFTPAGSPSAGQSGTFAGGTLVVNLGNDWLRDQVQGHFTSYADYPYAISPAVAAQMAVATRVTIELLSGNAGGGSLTAVENITQIYLETPAGSGAAVELQKWENSVGSANVLDFATDAASRTTIQVSGNVPWRFATAVEFATGSPASGMIGVAQDTDGTFAWASASSLSTLVEHRFVANGPYRVGDEVDGVWTPKKNMTLSYVRLYRRVGGASGSTQVTLTRNGTTMLSSDPTIAFNAGASATADGTISVTTVSAGDRIAASAVAVDTGLPRDAGFAVLVGAY